jgi:hypothetical protein
MKFLDLPALKMLPSGTEWRLLLPLIYLRHDYSAITVPTGFITDLASIPRIFHSLIPVNGKHSPAAIIHDYLYAVQPMSRAEADAIFLEAMEAVGVNWLRRKAMYAAVRTGGWVAWNERKKYRESLPESFRSENGL